jgi:hypothetical protein
VKYPITVLLAVIFAMVSVSSSCAGPGENPVTPGDRLSIQNSDNSLPESRYLWGYYRISGNTDTGEVRVVPVRTVDGHWNVLRWLEQGPCTACVSTSNIQPGGGGSIFIDIRIKHPFANPTYTGFDVRGIVLWNGSKSFPGAGLTVPDRSFGEGELLNGDGFTTLYNRLTSGSGPNGNQGYVQGKLASPTVPGATLNGFRRFVSNLAGNTRNAFFANEQLTVEYHLAVPSTEFVMGYAIDASWVYPSTLPVVNPMVDFPASANCQEPWNIAVTQHPVGTGLNPGGGETELTIDVYDWQGKNSHSDPVIEASDLFDGTISTVFVEDIGEYARYTVSVSNEKGASSGFHKCLISVVDDQNATSPDWIDLTAYHVVELEVLNGGWAYGWGAGGLDQATDVAIDNDNNVYVSGTFQGTVDLDPGDGIDMHSAAQFDQEDFAVSLSKFDPTGKYLWGIDFGGQDRDLASAVAVDPSNNIYITGQFDNNEDFDFGPEIDNHLSKGSTDVFITKYDQDGNYVWTRTFGGSYQDRGNGISFDPSGKLYVTGTYKGTVDFDPGPGVDEHTSFANNDSFLVKFDPNGDYLWGRGWGGFSTEYEYDSGFAVVPNGTDSVYVTGNIESDTDLDPGPGEDIHTGPAGYLSKFDSMGNYDWGATWDSQGIALAVDNSGNAIVTGRDGGIILRKYSPFGTLIWDKPFGGNDGPFAQDHGFGIDVDSSNNVFITGIFFGTRDFDPGAGVFEATSKGVSDFFVLSLDSDGDFRWLNTIGGPAQDYGRGLSVDNEGFPVVCGWYTYSFDFDPGEGENILGFDGGIDAFVIKVPPDGNWE